MLSAGWTPTCLGVRLLDELTLETPLRAPAATPDLDLTLGGVLGGGRGEAGRLPCEVRRLVAALEAELEAAATNDNDAPAERIAALFREAAVRIPHRARTTPD